MAHIFSFVFCQRIIIVSINSNKCMANRPHSWTVWAIVCDHKTCNLFSWIIMRCACVFWFVDFFRCDRLRFDQFSVSRTPPITWRVIRHWCEHSDRVETLFTWKKKRKIIWFFHCNISTIEFPSGHCRLQLLSIIWSQNQFIFRCEMEIKLHNFAFNRSLLNATKSIEI